MAHAKDQPGYSEVTFQREERRGFPMATFTAIRNNRHLFLHYVALGTAALAITYSPAAQFSAWDTEVWSRFINGLRAED
jgi:hypothetical protein